MKNKFFVVFSMILLVCCVFSCSSEESNEPPVYETVELSSEPWTSLVTPSVEPVLKERFTLDYNYLPAEKDSSEKRYSAKDLAGGTKGKIGEGHIPGLRPLSKYMIEYNDVVKKMPIANYGMSAISINENASSKKSANPLTIIDCGPKDFLSSNIANPSVYVVFSEPVIAIDRIGFDSSTSDFMTITPPLKGSFRWLGSRHLSFEGTAPCEPQQIYTVTINSSIKSLDGAILEGKKSFSFKTEEQGISFIAAGYDSKEKKAKFSGKKSDVPLESAKHILVGFKYSIDKSAIEKWVCVRLGEKELPFTVEETETPFQYVLNLKQTPPENSTLTVALKTGARSSNGSLGTSAESAASFSTLKPFVVRNAYTTVSYGRYSNPARILFSHDVDFNSVVKNIRTVPEKKITKDNLAFYGDSVMLFGLDVDYGEKYEIHFSGVRDIYGRELDSSSMLKSEIEVANAASFADFLDYGFKIMEAQFPHRLVMDYQNIPTNGSYWLLPIKNPLFDYENYGFSYGDEYKTVVEKKALNERSTSAIEFDEHLGASKKGAVYFTAKIPYKSRYYNYAKDRYEEETYITTNHQVIQVTDIGITARYGLNKIVVWVNSMQTGKPIANADVFLFPQSKQLKKVGLSQDVLNEETYVTGKTNAQGLFIYDLKYSEESGASKKDVDFTKSLVEGADEYSNSLCVAVKNKDDFLIIPVRSHEPWRSGVYSNSYLNEYLAPRETVMLYTDRGLYKPGETLSFSGIHKTRYLGAYLPPVNLMEDARVTLKSINWDAKPIRTLHVGLEPSGSFYGVIDLPSDLEPGTYLLNYSYGDKDYIASEEITVAYFERLKVQSSISVPPTPVIAGEQAVANLSASYLAGGYLGGASYSSNWIRRDWGFYPNTPEAQDYVFGVSGNGYARWIAETGGALNANGEATVTCKTTLPEEAGVTSLYSVEATVTDASNQMIAASSNVVVHPASYYIGVLREESKSGYPVKGDSVKFKYLLVDLEGNKLVGNKNFNSSKMNIDYTFVKESWVPVQREGLSDYLYTQYEKIEETVSRGKLPLQTEGSFLVTPNEPGFYILQLSAIDNAGRKAVTETSLYVSGSGASYWHFGSEGTVSLRPDKSSYVPGETAKVLLQSPLPKGDYLVTVEREGIFSEEVKHFDGNTAVIDVPIAKNYTPVVYVSVCSFSVRQGEPTHEFGTKDFDKPKAYFGVTPVFINPRVKAFSVDVEYDKSVYRPGEDVTVKIKTTRSGNPVPFAELTLMAVDRGVLDLINYHVKDPIEFFYNEGFFPLGVLGGASYNFLMDPVTYQVKNLAGGDATEESKSEERKDFNPTAVFEPGITTDKNGEATFTFKLPDNLTTYRMTVVGVKNDIFALKEQELAVQNPINVSQVTPRRLRVRDTAEAGVLLTNLDKADHSVTVTASVKTSPYEKDGKTFIGGTAAIDGNSSVTVIVPSGASVPVYFDVAALAEGRIELVFEVSSDVLNEKLIQPLEIEKSSVKETFTSVGQIPSGEKTGSGKEVIVNPFDEQNIADFAKATGISLSESGKNASLAQLSVTVDATQLSTMSEAAQYTFNYPYGCLEQRSSAIYPLVIFGEYIDALGLSSKVKDYKAVIKTELDYWMKCQLDNGGFPYWPDSTIADFDVSTRIFRILTVANQKGLYSVDSKKLEKLRTYILTRYKKLFSATTPTDLPSHEIESNLNVAYDYSFTNTLPDSMSKIIALANNPQATISAKALAGIALYNAGNASQAKVLANEIRNYLRLTTRGVDVTDTVKAYSSWGWRGSMEETLSLLLELFVKINPKDEINNHLLHSLLSLRRANGGYWRNTAATFRVFSAVDALIVAQNLTNTNEKVVAKINSFPFIEAEFKGLDAKPSNKIFDFTEESLKTYNISKLLNLVFEKEGEGSVFYTTSLTYSLPSELQISRDHGIEVQTRILDKKMNEPIKSTELESGKTYTMEATVTVSKLASFVALRVPVPSGCEIVDATFVTSASENFEKSYSDYHDDEEYFYDYGSDSQKIYDNEVQYFWGALQPGTKTVRFSFRASRRGVYPVPPALAECMYEPEIFGRNAGKLFTIK